MKKIIKEYKSRTWEELTDEEKENARVELEESQVIDEYAWEINNSLLESRIAEINKNYKDSCLIDFNLQELYFENRGGWLCLDDRDYIVYDLNLNCSDFNGYELYIDFNGFYRDSLRSLRYVDLDDIEITDIYPLNNDLADSEEFRINEEKTLIEYRQKIVDEINKLIDEINWLIDDYCDLKMVDFDTLIQDTLEQQEYTDLVEEREEEI